MSKRRVILILVGSLACIGVFVELAGRNAEPRHGGRKLSEWVMELTSQDWHDRLGSVEAAVHQMGVSNVLPYLIAWMAYETPPWKLKVYRAVNPIIARIRASWHWAVAPTFGEQRAIGATRLLVKLGPEAASRIGETTPVD